MSAGHTPGPWTYADGHHATWAIYATGPHHLISSHQPIAEIPRIDHDERGLPVEEANANARLIAAAPELLDALRMLIEFAERKIDGPAQYGQVLKARAAIAKATGGAK